jgi:YhcH/YjgK/YiaL family protein
MMIIDLLTNAEMYARLNSRITVGLNFLRSSDLTTMEPGKYPIDGSDIYALIQSYQTKPKESGVWEAHRRYFDIQYVVEGTEKIGYANLDALVASQPYDAENDFVLFSGHGDFLTLNAGMFAIFAPQDAHMPCIVVHEPQQVKKVVVKVRV